MNNMIIKLFISDIDGVWTDGGMYYDQLGNEWKKFNTADSVGVLFLRMLGIKTAIITGEDTEIVKRRAMKLNVDYLYMGIKNKVEVARSLRNKLGISFHEMAFIGDGINDINLLTEVGISAVPSNTPDYISKYAKWKLAVKGGDGAFTAFVERYLNEQNLFDDVLKKYLSENSKLENKL